MHWAERRDAAVLVWNTHSVPQAQRYAFPSFARLFVVQAFLFSSSSSLLLSSPRGYPVFHHSPAQVSPLSRLDRRDRVWSSHHGTSLSARRPQSEFSLCSGPPNRLGPDDVEESLPTRDASSQRTPDLALCSRESCRFRANALRTRSVRSVSLASNRHIAAVIRLNRTVSAKSFFVYLLVLDNLYNIL